MYCESNKNFTTHNARYRFHENNYIEISHCGLECDHHRIEENFEKLGMAMNGVKYNILFNIDGFEYSGKRMRILTMNFLNKHSTGFAIVSRSIKAYQLGCIIAAMADTTCPVKIFKQKPDALLWLHSIDTSCQNDEKGDSQIGTKQAS
jgi:hypothetical protein